MKIENSGIVSRQSVGGVPKVAPSIEEEHRHQEHFKTDHLLTNLKGHTISSGAVTVSAQGAKFLLNMASTMILARLLMPRDFGLVAMVMTVANHARTGLQSLLDQCRCERCEHAGSGSVGADYSTVLW